MPDRRKGALEDPEMRMRGCVERYLLLLPTSLSPRTSKSVNPLNAGQTSSISIHG